MLGIIFFLGILANTIKAATVTLSPNPTADVSENNPLMLTCTTTYTMKFLWIIDSSWPAPVPVITIGNNGGNCLELDIKPGYEIECDTVNGPYKITIKSVNLSHQNSRIKCQIQYGSSSTSDIDADQTTINVNVPPVIKVLEPAGIVTKNASDTQKFTCSATSVPLAVIKWHVGGSVSTTQTQQTKSGNMVSSTFIYTAQKADNGKKIFCTANNGKAQASANTSLVIQYLPVVELSPIYNPYDVIENTTDVHLKCIVKEANPNVIAYRWYKNDAIYPITDAILVIKHVLRSDDDSIYSCKATNIVGSIESELTLNVLYGVTVSAIKTQQPIEGDAIFSMICEGQSNPEFEDNNVIWTKQDHTFSKPGKQLSISNVNRNDSGIYICTVALTLISSEGNSTIVTGKTSVQVDVLYRPVVAISPDYNPYNVIENTTNVKLICTVKEANPSVTSYKWKNNDIDISSNANYTIPTVRRAHGGNYSCYAINTVGQSGSSVILKVNVLYGVIIDSINKQTPTEGSKLSLTCTGQAYPSIRDDEVKWTKLNNNTFMQIGQQLVINSTNRLDNGSYVCTVTKSLIPSDGTDYVVTGSTVVTVDILFPPLVEITTNKNVQIQENATNFILTCFVNEANPAVETYKWYKDGKLIPAANNLKKYIVEKVFRSDAGHYRCEGINSVGGSNSTRVDVNVLYGVTLNVSSRMIIVNESETLSILCTALGNPLPELIWINTYNKSVIDKEVSSDAKDMTIVNANCIDTGIYACIGNNSVGDIAFFSVNISVTCHPRTIDNMFTRNIVVNGINGMLTISEVFISNPIPKVSWSRKLPDGNDTDLDSHFNISDHQFILPFKTESTLHKEEMQRELFGTYIATAVNDYGSYVVTYIVNPKGKPLPPTNASATCGITSITVTWISRFNGGDNQTFRVLFRRHDSNKTTWSSDDKADEGEGRYITLREESFVPNSLYEILVETKNSFGGINSSETTTCITGNQIQSTSTALMGGLAGAISALLIIIVAVISFFMLRRRKTQGDDKDPIKRGNHHDDSTDEDEDGLKDNPLYVTTHMSETPKADTDTTRKDMEEGPVYSQVARVGLKGKKEKHEKKQKNAYKNGQDRKDIELGIVYENADKLLKNQGDEDVYANALSGKDASQISDTGNQYRSLKNKDGLIYADLDLVPQPNGKRFVIRGIENRNNYAIIDLSKTAEPLPSDDTDEEDMTNIQKS